LVYYESNKTKNKGTIKAVTCMGTASVNHRIPMAIAIAKTACASAGMFIGRK